MEIANKIKNFHRLFEDLFRNKWIIEYLFEDVI